LLTELFLKHGNRVFGVEPNREMRKAGEKSLAQYANFTSIDGTAESTGLPDSSVDFITVGQAFHWFDRDAARKEFERILKPSGWVVIVWNGFEVDKTPIVSGYQNVLLRYGTDFRGVGCEIAETKVETFFSPSVCKKAKFEFQQVFDFEGFKGRVLSASYAPEPGEPNYQPLIDELKVIFSANQKDGKVAFDYDTEVYYGQFV
jgi:SAM-dependent methyltransferase